mgnify:CR=1 FL=1
MDVVIRCQWIAESIDRIDPMRPDYDHLFLVKAEIFGSDIGELLKHDERADDQQDGQAELQDYQSTPEQAGSSELEMLIPKHNNWMKPGQY